MGIGAVEITDKVLEACSSADSVSAAFAKDPEQSPGKLASKLYGSNGLHVVDAHPKGERAPASPEQLERARRCGKFGDHKPSDLFLQAFHDVLCTLDHDLLHGCVSPSLIGTLGYVPFSVIGPLNDIARHMSNLIVRAKKEVLLATNYWMASGASGLITDALRELNRRAGERGQKIPVRIMYDRGNIKQLIEPHQKVPPATYASGSIKLPDPKEVPHLDLQVVNFHRPMLGTFHAKFMVVDREIAMTQSNNIQDNDNTEMMAQLEGPIVDSLWDTFLITWHNTISPLACAQETAAGKPPPTFEEQSFTSMFDDQGRYRAPDDRPAPSKAERMKEHVAGDPHWDVDVAAEVERMRHVLTPEDPNESQADVVCRHLNQPTKLSVTATAPSPSSSDLHYHPYIPLPRHAPVPIALVSRKPYGQPTHTSLHVPQNEAFLSLLHHAQRGVFIQTPDLNASPLLPAIVAACLRGVEVTYYVCLGYNDAGELLPKQGGTNEMVAHKLATELAQAGGDQAAARLHVHYYVAKDQVRPIHNRFKQRSCHIKLLIADGQVAVQGSGNQDTQSWWQSQEVNVMIDSAEVCAAWREGIERNQNTAQYGKAGKDGVWRGEDGKEAEGSLGLEPGKFAWAKGIVGAVNRARGAGGF